ncbi:YdeI/OmpD-associated family protein [Penaeicola halotolerans]|uniref:YdeI/OmpD-associated family protein n=1 Tax=Penaeicola halotolerans TaxID=2793196 RepID=UPI001CF86F33|nr:YdeI/OmpD-associated family protein [Penaeicola halotolerans]
MMHIFESILEKFDSNLWQYHLPIPEEIALSLIIGDNKRVICRLNEQTHYQTALMKSTDYWYVLVNKEIRTKLNIYEGDKVNVLLEKDHSEYGHEVPEELQVLFDQEGEAYKIFKQLTMGKQRSLIYIVTSVKNSQSRLNKSLAIIRHLKESEGKLDFKQLNTLIKYYNNL